MARSQNASSIITLTTDFGLSDWFVGVMKGVILEINPHVRLVDLTHAVPAGDIRAGAFALAAGYRYFPANTVHLVVVDPGVGGDRAALVVHTRRYWFVGPDNGVLSWALRREQVVAVHRLESARYRRSEVSHTFHGRDVFAPAAAWVTRGVPIQRFGPRCSDWVRLPWPGPVRTGNEVRGQVLYIDRFGNAITNIDAEHLPADVKARGPVTVGGRRIGRWVHFYAEGKKGQPVALISSTGQVEIAVPGGSAARRLNLKVGTSVSVRLLD